MNSWSLLTLSLCISLYWLTVFIKSVIITVKIGKAPNVLPKEWQGILSRIFMLPMIIYWLIVPWRTLLSNTPSPLPILSGFGAILACVALGLSYYCWHVMGNHWRIGIDPKEKTQVINNGPFKYSRHPIYALSILLMLATLLTLQSKQALLLSCIHFVLFYFEALREERYMLATHKEDYAQYAAKTARFFSFSASRA